MVTTIKFAVAAVADFTFIMFIGCQFLGSILRIIIALAITAFRAFDILVDKGQTKWLEDITSLVINDWKDSFIMVVQLIDVLQNLENLLKIRKNH